jgi:hypothetical protein
MFLMNLGYGWPIAAAVDDLEGVVIIPAHNDAERVRRTSTREFSRVLVDPQLYLAGLSAEDCSTTCCRLATYPWFGVEDLPRFDSSSEKKRDWKAKLKVATADGWLGEPPSGDAIREACIEAIDFQIELGCSHIILPSPLVTEREDEAELQAIWLDAAMEVVEESDVAAPVLASIAIADSAVSSASFDEAAFLDTIVDQVTTRDVHGVYIVVVQTGPADHPFDTPSHLLRAYAHLSARFGETGLDTIVVNFADVFGLGTLAHGATAFATGASRNLRRMSLAAYRDAGGGRALPSLYSHKMLGEYLSETHLDQIAEVNMLRRVSDRTHASQPLLAALRAGRSAGNVVAWAESQNNIDTAKKHFVQAMQREAVRLAGSKRPRDSVIDWLETAAASRLLLRDRLGRAGLDPSVGRHADAEAWLDALSSVSG